MTQQNERSEDEDDAIASRPMEPGQTGESGGGPYPNQRDDSYPDAHDFKGGQSDQAYYGKGQLGDKKVDETENAPSEEH
jgi:hypothetical protein